MVFREMIYRPEEENEYLLLAEGRNLGYHWVIISYGTHPCCYIQITNPKHPYYHLQYDDIKLRTKGTISYSRRYLKIPDEANPPNIIQNNEPWWIGWDYARTGFYNFGISEEEMTEEQKQIANRKKLTTQELVEECMSVIIQLEEVAQWKDIFNERWSEPGEYQWNKEHNRIEELNK